LKFKPRNSENKQFKFNLKDLNNRKIILNKTNKKFNLFKNEDIYSMHKNLDEIKNYGFNLSNNKQSYQIYLDRINKFISVIDIELKNIEDFGYSIISGNNYISNVKEKDLNKIKENKIPMVLNTKMKQLFGFTFADLKKEIDKNKKTIKSDNPTIKDYLINEIKVSVRNNLINKDKTRSVKIIDITERH